MKRARIWEASRLYGHVRSRELEGTIQDKAEVGVYLLTANRIRVGWGIVSETRWPYDGRTWPPIRPQGHDKLDQIAHFNRSGGYLAVRNLSDARCLLAQHIPFQITVPISRAWSNPRHGIIPATMSLNPSSITGTHAVLICGYDDNQQLFLFRNSWGKNWGNGGYGYLPYSYFRWLSYEAWAEDPLDNNYSHIRGSAFGVATSRFTNWLGFKASRIVAIDGRTGKKIGWAFCTCRDGYLDIEEVFVNPSLYSIDRVKGIAEAMFAERQFFQLPFRFWLSHCDFNTKSYNHVLATNVAAGLGLKFAATSQRWASLVAT